MSDNWYYIDGAEQIGPVTLKELKEALATFADAEDLHVWCARYPDWKLAVDVPELNALFPPLLPPEKSQPDNRGKMARKTGYVFRILQPGEYILFVGHLHWIIYTEAVIAFILSIACFLISQHWSEDIMELVGWVFGLVLLAASVLIAAKAWFDQWITEIAITNRRVIYKRGFIKRHTVEMNMDKIESSQSLDRSWGACLTTERFTYAALALVSNIFIRSRLRSCCATALRYAEFAQPIG
jgi:hypothetical protein